MHGEIWALFLAVLIILVAVFKSLTTRVSTLYCKKSEILNLLEDISEDTVVQISVGRNIYEHKRTRNH